MSRHGLIRPLLLYAALVLWALVCLLPLYWVLITSVKDEDAIMQGPRYLPFGDFVPTLKAWSYILLDRADTIVPSLINSAGTGLIATAVTMVLASMLVFGVTRFASRQSWIMSVLLATRILPPVILAIPAYLMAAYTRTLDTWFALIIAYSAINLPVAIWLLQPVLGKRKTDQEEAATLEGVSQFGILFRIVLPMVASSFAAIGLIIFILCWNESLFAGYLTSDHAITLPPFLEGQMSMKEAQVAGEAEEWARFSAATVLLVTPLLALATFVQRALGKVTERNQG